MMSLQLSHDAGDDFDDDELDLPSDRVSASSK